MNERDALDMVQAAIWTIIVASGPAVGAASLLELWAWNEGEFLRRTEGSAIRRIGWQRWRRNLAVALGNARRATGDAPIEAALKTATDAIGIRSSCQLRR